MRPISVRVSPVQRAHAGMRASEHGLTVSSYVRRLIDEDRGAPTRTWGEVREQSWAEVRGGSWGDLRDDEGER